VRRRGRRRTHRRIAAAAAAVVGLLAGGALVARPQESGRGEPAASPAVSLPADPSDYRGIPGRLLLRPADFPPTYWYTEAPQVDGLGPFPIHIACVDSTVVFESRTHYRAERTVRFHHEADRALVTAEMRDPTVGPLLLRRVTQNVTEFDPGWAARGIAEHRAWIDHCPGRVGMTYTTVDQNVGGDESVVYLVQQARGANYYLAIVRVGDRVTVLSVSRDLSADTARDLAQKAARRLGS
jgi:hypothetical protein